MTNLLDLNDDVLNIIGDSVKKDNHERIQKICKRYVKLYERLDTNKELERTTNLKGEEKKEHHKRFIENLNHFETLEGLIEKKSNDCITQFENDFCRTKPFLAATVLKEGKYQRFRYF